MKAARSTPGVLVEDPPQRDPPEDDPPQRDPPQRDPPQRDPPEGDPPQRDPPEGDPPQRDPPVGDPPEDNPPQRDPPQRDPPQRDPPQCDPPELAEPPRRHAHQRLATTTLLILFLTALAGPGHSEDGYELWLRYWTVSDDGLLESYRSAIRSVVLPGGSATLTATRDELARGLRGLLGAEVPIVEEVVGRIAGDGVLLAGTPASSPRIAELRLADELRRAGDEGFVLRSTAVDGQPAIVLAANTDVGVLRGAFHLLRLLQTHQRIDALALVEAPRIRHRVLDHWDNLDRTVERGYAGFSLWDWHELPDHLDPRYTDYARANASLGVNGTVLTNVNADATALTGAYLEKTAALAGVFRPWGLRVYLTARFSAPAEIGGLDTADPLDAEVAAWWRAKVAEIYRHIPDFGGFLVKANSEGQPGPQDYGRSHAEGANLLADALAPHGGIVMWRAFVYADRPAEDRAKQAYDELTPLDGRFRPNVLVQVKNGPIDFQPREPFHPLFGAMPETPLMLELQITQEYLGFATHLAFLGPLWEEVLRADTHARGPGSLVARVVDGSLDDHRLSGIAGVANTGTDRNWCGSVMACANWYAFGRLAWDPALSSKTIAEEWIRSTFGNDPEVLAGIESMLLGSREAVVDYMTPLGLHHLMTRGHHYGPGPWVSGGPRTDWTSVYYHRADAEGIGFDRTATGSDAVGQYFPPVRDLFGDLERVPEELLLWFHHVPWDRRMSSGRTLWRELLHRYQRGVERVREMQATWRALEGRIDGERYSQVRDFLAIQEKEARWWRDACVRYFQSLSGRPIPEGYELGERSLEELQAITHAYAPGWW
ncbi:MAG TPA: alpha-glucuronidase family glycosyl hydrolase [Thermoanaerobaculia bacterium]|nr:alpha-glucuronidase family glycosyl hydrolase [Thermoanaerobaculia bacterium]